MNLTHKPIEISDLFHGCMAGRSQKRRKKPPGITLWEMHLVVFRAKSGKVATLEVRCTHCNTPFSKGNICQDQLECPDHGW